MTNILIFSLWSNKHKLMSSMSVHRHNLVHGDPLNPHPELYLYGILVRTQNFARKRLDAFENRKIDAVRQEAIVHVLHPNSHFFTFFELLPHPLKS